MVELLSEVHFVTTVLPLHFMGPTSVRPISLCRVYLGWVRANTFGKDTSLVHHTFHARW